MKNFILFLLCLPFCLQAQNIPNAGFENWLIGQVILEVEDWKTSNFYTFNQFGIYSVNPDNIYTAEGYTSARLSTESLDTLGAFAAFLVSGSPLEDHVTGELDIMSGGTPFPYRPTKMKGKYRFESESPIEDFAQARVILKKYNSGTGERDTIGYGENVMLNPSMDFQEFEVPINYNDPTTIPDSVIVILYSTYPNSPIEGGTLWVDDLSFEFTTAISNIDDISDVKIFPNPFSDFFRIELDVKNEGQLDLIDLNGRNVISKNVNNGKHTLEFDLRGLPSGNYFLSWRNENGKISLLEKLIKTD